MDQRLRELGLVALQAAVLTRRIFLPPTRRHELAPEAWQILIALALTETASYADEAVTSPESLAAQLSLDRDRAEELLFELIESRHVVVEDDPDEDDPGFRLSAKGADAAREYIERAGRFLPGWPPAHAPD
jgi:hypothetical protein